jgi:membrane protease YdiL (CAAX protease family)
LVGIGEEPLFRGMVMTVLGKYMRGMHRIGNWEIPSSGIVAAVLFMLAHVGFTFSPFAITHFSLLQQFTALGLGLYYAYLFHRTGSLLGPILVHNFSDGIILTVRYSMALMFR